MLYTRPSLRAAWRALQLVNSLGIYKKVECLSKYKVKAKTLRQKVKIKAGAGFSKPFYFFISNLIPIVLPQIPRCLIFFSKKFFLTQP